MTRYTIDTIGIKAINFINSYIKRIKDNKEHIRYYPK